eukprot:2397806-Amphidinium_carterae.1
MRHAFITSPPMSVCSKYSCQHSCFALTYSHPELLPHKNIRSRDTQLLEASRHLTDRVVADVGISQVQWHAHVTAIDHRGHEHRKQ